MMQIVLSFLCDFLVPRPTCIKQGKPPLISIDVIYAHELYGQLHVPTLRLDQ